jgi:hypothetical protein
MMLYFPQRYFFPYFPQRYFQIKEDVVIGLPDLGGEDISREWEYSTKYDIDRGELLKSIKLKSPGSRLIALVNEVLVKVSYNEDEEILLSLINLALETKSEKAAIDVTEQLIEFIDLVDKEDRGRKFKDKSKPQVHNDNELLTFFTENLIEEEDQEKTDEEEVELLLQFLKF